MDEIKGFFRQAGKEFLNAAGDAAMGAAKEVMGSVINEIFIKKEAETKRILPSIKNMRVLGERPLGSYRPQTEVQDFETIRRQCLENGSLFEDPLFTASNESLMFSRRPDRHIEWLRPHEIVDDPQFFVEGYSRFDVQQGELGDCWLLAATANLTQDSNLFFRVVPPDQSFDESYAGVFHFCFWQYGKWIDVVIDDRLPTYRGELMYMHSAEKNEFWSALLEKAYAKLHGSYEALKGGSTCEAMEDFTGGVTEWYDLKEAPSNLFNILAKAAERNSMMGCSLEADPNVLEAETPEGLIRGHAYSITKVCMIDIVTPNRQGKIPMIRLRNPWGNEAEWNGPWSDSSPEWRYIPDDQKHEIGLNFDRDGEFWMSFQDFLNHFERVEICNLSPDSLTETQQNDGKRKWEMSMFEGEWTAGVTAGGCRNFLDTFWHNPQYVISLEDPDEEDDDGKCTVIVALMQKNRRSKRNLGMECLTIGFAIYHLNERDLQVRPQGLSFFKYKASVARSPHFINTREVTARFRLPPGHYLIVPSTFDPNEEGEFIIRVFSETQNNMEENDDHVGYGDADNDVKPPLYPSMPSPVKPVDPQRDALQRLFNSVAGADMEVDWMELKRILDHSLRDDLPKSSDFTAQNVRENYAPLSKENGEGPNNNNTTELDGNNIVNTIISLLCGLCNKNNIDEMLGLDEQNNTTQRLVDHNATDDPNNTVMMASPEGFSKDVCRAMVAMLDADKSGKLGFEEFEALLTDIAKWKAVFKVYDVYQTGRIDGFQLRAALNSAGYHLNNHILNALAHRYGTRDGKIAFDDFLMCAVKIKTYMDIFNDKDTEHTGTATFTMDEWIESTIYS
ncbi:calpain-A isoform X2 [Lucilia sericata]|uniref:calpain-A isoform X2 n=1 Tax=Lucilia sericata TaxID=13632 RepID=UPI0018A86472|nr:calpain-A isoform X2 [Lucilia sericata]XP_037806997.1 calpain-A isoform X2 [Lucilia sericata]XP_037806998.1 calpain-A isoform X2 [Lucilia sericata]XP_037806999.1 calpain-A isoform X2 [Lucilia sericata]